MCRLAATATNQPAATSAAKAYFQDLNDMFVSAKQKNGPSVLAAYQKSLTDLTAFKALIK